MHGGERTRGLQFGTRTGTEWAGVSGESRVEFDVVDIGAHFGENAAGSRRYNEGPGQQRKRSKGPSENFNKINFRQYSRGDASARARSAQGTPTPTQTGVDPNCRFHPGRRDKHHGCISK